MAVLQIRKYPDPVLRQKAQPVGDIDEALRRLIQDMAETMYAAPGIGLAAPQVGVPKQVIVVDISTQEQGHPLIALINPEILEAHGEVESQEGCLSLPEFTTTLRRAQQVLVRGLSPEGKPLELEATGLLAIALQHEIDHLQGTLILDRASLLSREFYKKRLKKLTSAG
jgi:peptide deformylase